jgi:transposase-like protein
VAACQLASYLGIVPSEHKGHFPTEDAARKLIYLTIHNAVPQWTQTRGWTKALLAFKIQFGDRLPD